MTPATAQIAQVREVLPAYGTSKSLPSVRLAAKALPVRERQGEHSRPGGFAVITRSAARSLVAAIAVAAVVAAVVQPWYVYVPSFEALDHVDIPWYVYVPSFEALDHVDIPTGDFNFAIVTDGPTSTAHLWLTTSLKALLILATSMVLLGPVARLGGRSLWLGAAAGSLLIALGVSIYVLASPSLWTAGLTCLCGASLALVLLAIAQPAGDVIR